ncbi:sensor histidine kinase [Saccharibacillus kuerlensis]|uniref:histidine kinase n=1 Tax=Saccharibacillus kuerlensis TaxID=459527 RepID=A0ABQ2L7X4_9BACL|nr:HAMP domain-containing sensor histidine kinase [Saccharibacillus kuerlensis]GGO06217.1 two-component sensor histidine kinase [Saccharibacillus kuerlensis]
MKRLGVTAKLFIVTASIFVLFYILVLLAQLVIFPQFYEHRKMANLQKTAAQLAVIYNKDPSGRLEPNSPVMLGMHREDITFALTDFEGSTIANNPFRMRVIREDGLRIDTSLFYLSIAYKNELEDLKLTAGEEVTVYGQFDVGKYGSVLNAYYVAKTSNTQESDSNIQEAGEKGSQEDYYSVTGRIETTPHPDKSGKRLGLIFLALDELFPLSSEYVERLNNMESVELVWSDSLGASRSGIFIRPLRSSSGQIELLLLVTSLQEIKETNSALRVFFAYLGAGGLVLIVLLSILYSRLVTRPLLMLNRKAEKMKRMDFSGEEPVPRSDELGNLSNTLFELSGKLGVTLEELNTTNIRLKQEIEQNKELEQLQKDFFANASHELKTPISIVRGFAEGMRDGISAGRQDHYVGVILEESEKMEQLVQDMLDLLRLESPAVKLYKSPLLLSEMTEEMLQKLIYRMREKNLAAHIVRSEERRVIADAGKIEQVLLNLLTNAIRHAEPGSTIEIFIDGSTEGCVYSVHNKGESIPEPYLTRIWERFFRAEAARDRKSGGTGLGLAIVKRILELHECSYQVENEKEGVTFTLKFPV